LTHHNLVWNIKVVFNRGALLAPSPQNKGIVMLCVTSHYDLYTWKLNCVQTIWDKNWHAIWEHLGELGVSILMVFFLPILSVFFFPKFVNKRNLLHLGVRLKLMKDSKYGKRWSSVLKFYYSNKPWKLPPCGLQAKEKGISLAMYCIITHKIARAITVLK